MKQVAVAALSATCCLRLHSSEALFLSKGTPANVKPETGAPRCPLRVIEEAQSGSALLFNSYNR